MDAAQVDGWSSVKARTLTHQQRDDATILQFVEHPTELRQIG